MNLKLPNTYGNFGVGKSIQVLTDESRQEKYDSGKRRIITYIFYPSDTKAGNPLQVLEKIQLLVLNFFNSYLKNKPLDKRNFETIQDIIFESKNNK